MIAGPTSMLTVPSALPMRPLYFCAGPRTHILSKHLAPALGRIHMHMYTFIKSSIFLLVIR